MGLYKANNKFRVTINLSRSNISVFQDNIKYRAGKKLPKIRDLNDFGAETQAEGLPYNTKPK